MWNECETKLNNLRFRRFVESDALSVMSWQYPNQYSVYDMRPTGDSSILDALLLPENNYHAILLSSEMIGYFCIGADARVPGWPYDESQLDLGMGVRPDLTGRGNGQAYLQAVLSYIAQHWSIREVRATIMSWNERAIRMCQRAGFRSVGRFRTTRKGHLEYVVLARHSK